jgi:hypothetical protein
MPEGAVNAGLLVLAGAIYCFLGYRLFKLILGGSGFLLAAAPAILMCGSFTKGNLPAMAVAGILGGICGMCALFFLFRLGVFLFGATVAGLVAHQALLMSAPPWLPWAVLGSALAGGLGAVWLERPAMTLSMAALGGWLLVVGGIASFDEAGYGVSARLEASQWGPYVALAVWLGLTIMGARLQSLRAKTVVAAPKAG